jgi:hypothetical protein
MLLIFVFTHYTVSKIYCIAYFYCRAVNPIHSLQMMAMRTPLCAMRIAYARIRPMGDLVFCVARAADFHWTEIWILGREGNFIFFVTITIVL